ncbi:dTDP-4-dehydrorhamnose reductase [Candidatus Electronema sp. PJ]|uniref:dTDP-4-dehydrorhamnose reductase n=1 Tax=Candidatus Electronema sp. PJ TaxID=3401572 RepID=UPI003AA901D7
MKLLITGAGGQLGQDCVRLMLDRHEICALTSKQLDVTLAQHVQQMVHDIEPDVVINCAAFTAVDACEKEQIGCLAVNAQGAANLAEACADFGCRLLHISTDYVFDGQKPVPEPYTEEDVVAPISMYGKSKLAGEEEIAARMQNYLILRTAWLYGIGGTNFLKTMLRLALANPKRTIKVVNDQYGSLTWTLSLARQIERVLDCGLTGIVHATAEGHSTWYAGAKYFLEAMQVPFSLVPCTTAEYPTPAKRPANSILENRRLKEQGCNVMRPWQEDIDTFVEMYKEELLNEALHS